jgi:hypothetical protein
MPSTAPVGRPGRISAHLWEAVVVDEEVQEQQRFLVSQVERPQVRLRQPAVLAVLVRRRDVEDAADVVERLPLRAALQPQPEHLAVVAALPRLAALLLQPVVAAVEADAELRTRNSSSAPSSIPART